MPKGSLHLVFSTPAIAWAHFLLKVWILPVLGLTAKAYRPRELVTRHVKMIYRVSLRLNSLRLYFPVLSQCVERGSFALLPADTFLWPHAAYPYVPAVLCPDSYVPEVMVEV